MALPSGRCTSCSEAIQEIRRLKSELKALKRQLSKEILRIDWLDLAERLRGAESRMNERRRADLAGALFAGRADAINAKGEASDRRRRRNHHC